MSRPMDPTVLSVMERLLSVSEDTSSRIPRFQKGERGSDFVGHLEFARPSETFEMLSTEGVTVEFLPVAELFLSRQGTQLLHLAEEQRRNLAALGAPSDTDIFLFAELGPRAKSEAAPDTFSAQVFEVVANPNAESVRIETTANDLLFYASSLPSALGYRKKELEKLIKGGIVEAKAGMLASVGTMPLEAVAIIFDLIREGAQGVATFLKSSSRMPEGVWNPKERPKDWKKFIAALGTEMDEAIDAVRKELDGHRSDFAGEIAKIPGLGLFPVFEETATRIDTNWNGLIDFLNDVIDSIRDLKPGTSEATDAVLGFLSGLWDGIMDAVIGIFELVALAAQLTAAWWRGQKNIERTTNMILEVVDEVLQALGRIDWSRLWDWFLRAAPHLWNAAKERSSAAFERIVSNTAQAGYYFGYIVYMIVEFFLPPLKFSSLVRNARRLQSSRFFAKVFG